MGDIDAALSQLKASNISFERRDYGFRIMHPDLPGRGFMDSGMDNDSSISISVHTEEDPPTIWFFRQNFVEIAELLIATYAEISDNPTRAEIISAMRKTDESYDDTELIKMTDAFLGELEDEA